MASNVHFEIFKRQASGGWSLVEVRDRRDDALAYAHELEKSGVAGVKVIKETFNDSTGDFTSLKIYEHGEKKKKKSKIIEEEVPSTPCFRIDDLYSYHARKTIASLIPDFLAHHKVTVTELSHRADLLEKLEATGTLLQHAIQRVAVVQASTGENQLTKIIRGLHDLTTQAFHRVYKDAEKNRYAVVQPGAFADLAAKLATTSEGSYLLDGALTLYLKDCKGWDEKVGRLMALMEETKGDGDGQKLLAASIDSLISEVLASSASLRELIGTKENHGAAVMGLVKLFLGRWDETSEREGLTALTKEFGRDSLPNARVAIAQRIITEFRSFKRLVPNSLEDELRSLRQIANLVVTGVGKYLSHEELVNAFVLRSQRLVTNESLAPYLGGVTPDVKLDRILFVEENVIGNENKRRLVAFVTPVITGSQFEEYFQNSKSPLVQRLAQLEALRVRVWRSGFPENQRVEISDALDKVAAAVEAKNKLFESIDRRNTSPTDKAMTLMKLIGANALTSPRLTTKAREMILVYLGKPGFLTGYVAQAAQNNEGFDRETAVADLMKLLEKAGITPKTGLKTIAA